MGKILVTGGTGYLGTHMLVELVKQGYEPLCVDNLHNSNPSVLLAVKEICGKEIPFIKADAGDVAAMRALFAEYQIDAVIHFAGHKAVGESVAHPLMYYRNNYDSALTILEMCLKHGSALVFSSSATVYGVPHFLPLTEDHPLSAGQSLRPHQAVRSKKRIRDVALAHPEFNVSILRYFNPVGAHESGLIGENPNGIPNNLMPVRLPDGGGHPQGIAGVRRRLRHAGRHGRARLHPCDRPHLRAHRRTEKAGNKTTAASSTTSARATEPASSEMVHRFEAVNGVSVPYRIVARRPGDVASCYADPSKAV